MMQVDPDEDMQWLAALERWQVDYKQALAAEQLVFTVTSYLDMDDTVEVTPRLKVAFSELFEQNPRGDSRAFPFVASNGLKIDYRIANPVPLPAAPVRGGQSRAPESQPTTGD